MLETDYYGFVGELVVGVVDIMHVDAYAVKTLRSVFWFKNIAQCWWPMIR